MGLSKLSPKWQLTKGPADEVSVLNTKGIQDNSGEPTQNRHCWHMLGMVVDEG